MFFGLIFIKRTYLKYPTLTFFNSVNSGFHNPQQCVTDGSNFDHFVQNAPFQPFTTYLAMPKNLANFRGKYWCFTINNPTEDQHPPNIWPEVQYVIWQFEAGENNTAHIQGYVAFTKTKMLTWVLAHCERACHWEPRMGCHSQAKHYCMKPVPDCDCEHCIAAIGQRIAGPWEHGDDSLIAEGQGERNDIDHCKEMIDAGKTDSEIAEAHFGTWCRNYRAFERYRKLAKGKRRSWITHVTVLWGAPGIGKSRRARFEAGEAAYWLPKPEGNAVYWDGYDGEEHVVIDEFYGWIARTQLQRLCDSTPLMVNNKFGSTPFLAKKIWITSNDPPSQWYRNIGLGAMERRLTGDHGSVVHVTQPFVPPLQHLWQEALALNAAPNQADPPRSPPLDANDIAVPQDHDLAEIWALYGTPDDGPNEPLDDPLEQQPLSRCPACHARTELPQLCDYCAEHIAASDMDWSRCAF